ncbi:MAG: hypothetical protein N2115_03475, partial [bacterium]|nr:hypothetical protein [bacterium]
MFRIVKLILKINILLVIFFSSVYGFSPHITDETRNFYKSKEIVLIADKGVAKIPIVIKENADNTGREFAEELAYYLEKITGARFEIKTNFSGQGIFVGTIKEFPTPSAEKGL